MNIFSRNKKQPNCDRLADDCLDILDAEAAHLQESQEHLDCLMTLPVDQLDRLSPMIEQQDALERHSRLLTAVRAGFVERAAKTLDVTSSEFRVSLLVPHLSKRRRQQLMARTNDVRGTARRFQQQLRRSRRQLLVMEALLREALTDPESPNTPTEGYSATGVRTSGARRSLINVRS